MSLCWCWVWLGNIIRDQPDLPLSADLTTNLGITKLWRRFRIEGSSSSHRGIHINCLIIEGSSIYCAAVNKSKWRFREIPFFHHGQRSWKNSMEQHLGQGNSSRLIIYFWLSCKGGSLWYNKIWKIYFLILLPSRYFQCEVIKMQNLVDFNDC